MDRAPIAWLIVGAAAAGLAILALHHLSSKSFWYDEAVSLEYARGNLDAFLATATTDANGTLYYLLLHGWRLLGEGEARLRLLSMVCMLLTLPLLYLVGRRHVGRGGAVIACVLFAASPFVVEFAQEARMYGLVVLLTTGAVLAWSHATETDQKRWWAIYVVCGAAAMYTHFFSGFVVFGLGVTWLLGLVPRTRAGFVGQAVLVLATIPVAIFVIVSDFRQVAWIRPYSEAGVSVVLGKPGGGSIAMSALIYGAAIVAIPTRDGARVRRLAPIVAWWLAPVAIGLLVSVSHSLLEARYFIVALPAILLLAGAGMVRIGRLIGSAIGRREWWPAFAGIPLVLAMLLAVGPTMAWYDAPPRQDWRGAAGWIARTAEPGDRIVYTDDHARYPMGIYLDGAHLGRPVDTTVDDARASTGRTWLVVYGLSPYGYRTFMTTMPGYRVALSKLFSGVRVQLLEGLSSG